MTARWIGGFALALLFTFAPDSEAATCTISTSSVNFGTYNVFDASPLDSTGTVTYRCTGSATVITISLSRGSSTSFSPRTLRKGGESLNYNLYRNAVFTTIWGDGSGGTSVHFAFSPPNNTNVPVTVYGRVTAGQDVSAGGYTDSITATINF